MGELTAQPKLSPRMTPDEAWAMLEASRVGMLTTLRRDGVPIALPLWFAVVDRRIYTATRGQKLRRVERDSRSSFLVETGEAWSELRAVHLTGHSEIVQPDDPDLAPARAALAAKYGRERSSGKPMPQASKKAYAAAAGGMIRFTPDERIVAWDNRKLYPSGGTPAR